MKRSKTMLGLAALLLAGVGAFASIGNSQEQVYFYQNELQQTGCTQTILSPNCLASDVEECREFVPEAGAVRQLYFDNCTIPLEREGGF